MKIIFAILFILLEISQAHEYKAVFDCSSSDQKYITSRMILIEKTMNMIEADGDKTKFAVTIHGGCLPMVTKNYKKIVSDEDIKYISKSKEVITRLSQKRGVEVVACAIALKAHLIHQDNVLPFIRITKNSFMDTIKYQNLGYALMPLE